MFRVQRKRVSYESPPCWEVTHMCSAPQCCGVDFEVKAYVSEGTGDEEDKVPKK